MVGGGLFAYATVFNFTIPTRAVLLAVPLVLDFIRESPDSRVESKASEFLDWVIGYRKAKTWAERYRPAFNDEQVNILIKSRLKKLLEITI
jgi:hypothetical protein